MRFLIICSLLLFLVACTPKRETSFYYWKTNFYLDSTSKIYLEQLDVKKLYVRFFDIDLQKNKPAPVAHLSVIAKDMEHAVIPVVFITNRTFTNLSYPDIDTLAHQVIKEIEFMYPNISSKKMDEIQFDCDWTASTRDNYFYFLNQCKILKPKIRFSATIRMHQIKDVQTTGVPPVEEGVLMYYATSSPLEFNNHNSILENSVAAGYLKNLNKYPLKLNLALPIYSWAILENNYGEKRLINGIREENMTDTTLFLPLGNNFYVVKKDAYWMNIYLYENYKIKVEEITPGQLLTASRDFLKKYKNRELTTIFFQLDSSNLVHYSIEELNHIIKP